MGSAEQQANACTPPSSRERALLRALAKHYCGVHFVQNLEGFIHNLNSPLQILWMRSEQVQQDIGRLEEKVRGGDGVDLGELADRMKKRMDSFMRGFDQLNESLGFLTKDLLGKPRSEVGGVRVNEVIQDALFLMKSDMFFKHRVEVHLELGDDLPEVKGRHSDFAVILLHLAQNALDAMINSDVKDLGIKPYQRGEDIVVRIRDTGCGISEEDRTRIFEPFFTTNNEIEYNGKSENRLGLGLSITSLLLEEYNGSVSFESIPHETTFVVRFPF